MGRGGASRKRGTRRGEDDRGDQQGADEQEKSVLKGEPAVVSARRLGQVAGGGEHHRGRLPPGEQVQQYGNAGREKPEEHPRRGKADHASPVERTSACRSAWPKGVSVVTRS